MARKKDATYDRLIEVGLQDPFIRGIVGVVVIATAAGIAISILGSGAKAVLAIALSLAFGVVLVVLRALMKYVDRAFVRIVCFASSAVIKSVFLVFAVLLVPAAVICWPQPYAQLLSLPNCASALTLKPFTPIEYTGKGITYNPDNKKYHVLIFYRLGPCPVHC
jgi:predicted membrane channel-forming protein YqfA (hemolysin III family)